MTFILHLFAPIKRSSTHSQLNASAAINLSDVDLANSLYEHCIVLQVIVVAKACNLANPVRLDERRKRQFHPEGHLVVRYETVGVHGVKDLAQSHDHRVETARVLILLEQQLPSHE